MNEPVRLLVQDEARVVPDYLLRQMAAQVNLPLDTPPTQEEVRLARQLKKRRVGKTMAVPKPKGKRGRRR